MTTETGSRFNQLSERWITFKPETQEKINMWIREKINDGKYPFRFLAEDGFFVESGSEREKQLETCFRYAISGTVLDKVSAGLSVESVVGEATSHNVKVDGINTTLFVLFRVVKGGYKDEENYKRERSQILAKVNEILEAFDQPLLPQYSTRDHIQF